MLYEAADEFGVLILYLLMTSGAGADNRPREGKKTISERGRFSLPPAPRGEKLYLKE